MKNGVLVPLTVVPEGGRYTLVSGHRRKRAAKLAGLAEVPCFVREMTKDEAVIAMVDSNLQRESILPSERAFAYSMRLEAMRHQGERTDLTCVHSEHKLKGRKSRDILAEGFAILSKFVRKDRTPKVRDAEEESGGTEKAQVVPRTGKPVSGPATSGKARSEEPGAINYSWDKTPESNQRPLSLPPRGKSGARGKATASSPTGEASSPKSSRGSGAGLPTLHSIAFQGRLQVHVEPRWSLPGFGLRQCPPCGFSVGTEGSRLQCDGHPN